MKHWIPIVVFSLIACSDNATDVVAEDAATIKPDAQQQQDTQEPRPGGSPVVMSDATGLLGLSPSRSFGVSSVDYTGDGWPDITIASYSGLQLYRNRGDGTFEPDSKRSKIADYDLKTVVGVAYGDVDSNGTLDMIATTIDGPDRLYINLGEGVFEDRTEAAGLTREAVSQGASFGDLDGDGDLDIYVSALPAKDADPIVRNEATSSGRNLYWRNDGNGKFTDATIDAGLSGLEFGFSFGSIIFDIDEDNDMDLIVVHDFDRDQVFINDGTGVFTDLGMDYVGPGTTGLMGLDVGDIDGNGQLDVFATNWHADHLMRLGAGSGKFLLDNIFTESMGDGVITSAVTTGWGCALVDLDNDADQDIITTSAYTDGFGVTRESVDREGRILLLQNQGNAFESGSLVDITDQAGEAVKAPLNGYGLAVADFDRDGDIDVIVGVDQEIKVEGQRIEDETIRRTSLLLKNEGQAAYENKSIVITLKQPNHKNQHAVGARADTYSGDRATSKIVLAGSSYLSSSTYALHFGLGAADRSDRIIVTWPDGEQQLYVSWPAGHHTLERSDTGNCCVFGQQCTDSEPDSCAASASDQGYCEEICEILVNCDGAENYDLEPGNVKACVDQCADNPIPDSDMECFEGAEDCTAMFSCIGDE